MKKSLLSLLMVGLLVGLGPLAATQNAAAKDTPAIAPDTGLKPVAIMSIASYDRVLSDIAFIGRIAQQPGMDKQAEGMLMIFAQGLNGLDKARPMGVVVSTDGTAFPWLGFVPVTSTKELLNSLQAAVGQVEDDGTGVFVIERNNLKFYVKEQNGWAFIADSTDKLTDLPKDPTKLLDGLDKKFEVGLQFNVANVPEMLRTQAVDSLKEGLQSLMQRDPREDDATFELRQKIAQGQLKSLEDLVNDADQFALGWAIDQPAKSTFLDVRMTARPNSELAKKFGGFKVGPSNYSGFAVPKAALAAGGTQTFTKDEIEQANLLVDTVKLSFQQRIDKSNRLSDDASKTTAKGIVTDLVEAAKSTLAGGKSDSGFSILLGSKTLTGIGGILIGDPMRVEGALKKLADLAPKYPNIPKIKFNADKYGDVRFHTAKLPVPPGQDVSKVVGTSLDVAIGIGPKSVYLGLGTDVLGVLKKSIDKSKADATKPIAPFLLDVYAPSVVEFANAMEPNPLNQALSAELAKAPNKEHIQVVFKPITNGVTLHFEVQEAVLNMIGVAVKMQQGGGRPGGAGGPRRPADAADAFEDAGSK